MRALRPGLTVLVTLALVTCGAPRGPGLPSNPRDVPNTVVVVNKNRATVEIFAINLGEVYRLGSVETGGVQTFVLPTSAVLDGDLELRAHPVGLRVDQSTGPILFAPGETIEFTVENLLELSRIHVD
jgi:hypothetical protein